MPEELNATGIRQALARFREAQDDQRKALVTIQSRIELMSERMQRQAQMVARLKLMADNAKQAAQAQTELLQTIDQRLARVFPD